MGYGIVYMPPLIGDDDGIFKAEEKKFIREQSYLWASA
jgi:hypothetical protein